MKLIDIPLFINNFITKRDRSMFQDDFDRFSGNLRKEIEGSNILVIGGAGTIGSSFIKAMLPFKPAQLIVVDQSENGLTELTRDLRSQDIFIPEKYLTYPMDFGSPVFNKMFRSESFDVVASFAAHKHVRSEKDAFAIEAMVRNNVMNTKNLIGLCLQKKPKHFFCVSTDKATNPVNVMGVSKKLMENVLMAYRGDLKITTARFANVAFSNGSLLAGFLDRVSKSQPLSAPKNILRYFVSPEESGQLCLLACIVGDSGEIFFPKLAPEQMISFSEIADLFVKELGYKPFHCSSEQQAISLSKTWTPTTEYYPVFYFGSDTSGEKAYEEFFADTDEVTLDQFLSLGTLKQQNHISTEEADRLVAELNSFFNQDNLNKKDIVSYLTSLVPDFNHIERGKNLDQRM